MSEIDNEVLDEIDALEPIVVDVELLGQIDALPTRRLRCTCSAHLTRTVRAIQRPPHRMTMLAPAGAGQWCDFCGAKAYWTVHPQ